MGRKMSLTAFLRLLPGKFLSGRVLLLELLQLACVDLVASVWKIGHDSEMLVLQKSDIAQVGNT